VSRERPSASACSVGVKTKKDTTPTRVVSCPLERRLSSHHLVLRPGPPARRRSGGQSCLKQGPRHRGRPGRGGDRAARRQGVDRGLREGQFRGLEAGRLELPGEVNEAQRGASDHGGGYFSVASSPPR
jgi:hypothetical protein